MSPRQWAALIKTHGGSRRTQNRAGRFVAPSCITIRRSLYGEKCPYRPRGKLTRQAQRQHHAGEAAPPSRPRVDPPIPMQQKKRAERTARAFCAASPATSHMRSAHTAAAVGAAFTTHAHPFPSRLLLAACGKAHLECRLTGEAH